MPEQGQIAENYRRIRDELPEHVTIVAAAKTRSAEEIAEVIRAGAPIIGENYVQEAQSVSREMGEFANRAEWHMIGHLQRNKINKALPLFEVIQTVDTLKLARGISKRVEETRRVFIEVNVAGEDSKYGVPPDETEELLRAVSELPRLRVAGLMTMEPYFEDPEKARPYLRRMKRLFDELRALSLPNVDLEVLSMGMSGSYRVAVEEGATMVRLGTALFGPRR
jgi:hypothetical protein